MVPPAPRSAPVRVRPFRRIEYLGAMSKVIQHIYIIPLFVSAALGLRCIRLRWPTPYITFSILVLSVFFVEVLAILWKYHIIGIPNHPWSSSNLWIYNVFLLPQYLLYMALYYQVIRSAAIRKIIIALAVFYTVFALLNIFYIQHINNIDSLTLAVSSGIVIFLTIAYFEQLRKEEQLIRLTTHPMVWISLGAFIFHTANLPYLIGLNYLIHTNLPLAIALFYIFLALNCIMYTLYSVALLCPRPLHR